MSRVTPDEITGYWLDEVGPVGWYAPDDALDETIRARFMETWEAAAAGALENWLDCAPRSLAYVILTDQFPRNMFRDDPRAFSTDARAVRAAKTAINHRWDCMSPEPGRQFFYMPLVHSESGPDQARAVSLMLTRLPCDDGQYLLHARAHREVVRRFGRFPTRNAALGRESSGPERLYLESGGYGAVVRALSA